MAHPRDRLLTFTAAFAAIILLITLASRSHQTGSWTDSQLGKWKSQGQYQAQAQHPITKGDPFLQERINRAEKLFQQSIEHRQTMLDHYTPSNTPKFPDDYILPYHIWDFVRPSYYCPHDLERVGTLGDGGKWTCGMTRYEKASPGPSSKDNTAHPLVMYSFGVNDDSSFEAALLERTNIEIWGYDYSVDGWAKDIPMGRLNRAHFKKAGIGKTNTTASPPFYSVQDLMKENGHDFIDIMKMDIEGAEFAAIDSLIASVKHSARNNTLPIGQLLIEIHLMPDEASTAPIPKTMDAFLNWWRALEKMGMRPTNNEDNWIGDAGYCRPRFMEYTLINGVDTERNVLLWT